MSSHKSSVSSSSRAGSIGSMECEDCAGGSVGETVRSKPASRSSSLGRAGAVGRRMERIPSEERVRLLVQKEGLLARNLLSWNVPLLSQDAGDELRLSVDTDGPVGVPRRHPGARQGRMGGEENITNEDSLSPNLRKYNCPTANYKPTKSRVEADLRTRYWTFMFESLRRVVDLIYDTCLEDHSVIECKEAIMMLEICKRDFASLIEFLDLEANIQRGNRPSSIAWEIRKTNISSCSPTKPMAPPLSPSKICSATTQTEESAETFLESDSATAADGLSHLDDDDDRTVTPGVKLEDLAVSPASTMMPLDSPCSSHHGGLVSNKAMASFDELSTRMGRTSRAIGKDGASSVYCSDRGVDVEYVPIPTLQIPMYGGFKSNRESVDFNTCPESNAVRVDADNSTSTMEPASDDVIAKSDFIIESIDNSNCTDREVVWTVLADTIDKVEKGCMDLDRLIETSKPDRAGRNPNLIEREIAPGTNRNLDIDPSSEIEESQPPQSPGETKDPVPVDSVSSPKAGSNLIRNHAPHTRKSKPSLSGHKPGRQPSKHLCALDLKSLGRSDSLSSESSQESYADKVKRKLSSKPSRSRNTLSPSRQSSAGHPRDPTHHQISHASHGMTSPLSARQRTSSGTSSSTLRRNDPLSSPQSSKLSTPVRKQVLSTSPVKDRAPSGHHSVGVVGPSSSSFKRFQSPTMSSVSHCAGNTSPVVDRRPHPPTQHSSSQPVTSPSILKGSAAAGPRNASEIRQTKASLAKMQFNRKYLEQRKEKELLHAKAVVIRPSRPYHQPMKVSSVPNLLSSSQIAGAVSNNQWIQVTRRRHGGKFRSYRSSESLSSLQSIREDEVECDVYSNESQSLEPMKIDVESGGHESNKEKLEAKASMENAKSDLLMACKVRTASMREASFAWSEASSCLSTADEESEEASLIYLTEEEQSLAEEEESLQKEIEAEEKKSCEPLNDLDDDQNESEISAKTPDAVVQNVISNRDNQQPPEDNPSWQDIVDKWKAEFQAIKDIPWSELVEREYSEARAPGQAVQIHEKLSSPSRKRTMVDSRERYEMRQARAEEKRLKLQAEKANRLHELSQRVTEVQEARKLVVEQRRILMNARLERAAANRKEQIQAIVKKAHDEDEKVQEIAFINSLQLENRRQEVSARYEGCDQRLKSLQEERTKKQEEKAAREAAAEDRRKVLDEQRNKRLKEMSEKRKVREQTIKQQKSKQENQRAKLAHDKAKEREDKLAEVRANQRAVTEELLQKIQQKQSESLKRHEETLEHIKQRANELGTPRSSSACQNEIMRAQQITPPPSNPLANSVVASPDKIAGKTCKRQLLIEDAVHSDLEMEVIILPSKEDEKPIPAKNAVDLKDHGKANKRRRQTIKKKMAQKADEYNGWDGKIKFQAKPDLKLKFDKSRKEVSKMLDSCGSDAAWPDSSVHVLERMLGEHARLIKSKDPAVCESFCATAGLDLIFQLLSSAERNNSHGVPSKSLQKCCEILSMCASASDLICLHLLCSNQLPILIDLLSSQLITLSSLDSVDRSTNSKKQYPPDQLACSLLELLTYLFAKYIEVAESAPEVISKVHDGRSGLLSRLNFLISYIVSLNVVDHVAILLMRMIGSGSGAASGVRAVVPSLAFINGLIRVWNLNLPCELQIPKQAPTDRKKALNKADAVANDPTGLVGALVGRNCLISQTFDLLYTQIMSPSGTTGCDRDTPPPLSESTMALIEPLLDFVILLSRTNLVLVQDCLSSESSSLEFRHIASHLLTYANVYGSPELMHTTVLLIGYFTALFPKNQDIIHLGSQPSILQQLCLLPFPYFSRPHLSAILFPTLVSACYRHDANTAMLGEELNPILLAGFIDDQIAQCSKSSVESDLTKSKTPVDRFDLRVRFPRSEWAAARDYFQQAAASSG